MKNQFTIFGIGIFSWIAISLLAFFVERSLKNIFFGYNNVNPIVIYSISKILNISVYISGFLILAKKMKCQNFDENKTLKTVFILILLTTFLQIICPLITISKSGNYNSNRYKFLIFNETTPIVILNLIIELSIYVFIFFLILKNRNLLFNIE